VNQLLAEILDAFGVECADFHPIRDLSLRSAMLAATNLIFDSEETYSNGQTI
jgi:hypothetical protein